MRKTIPSLLVAFGLIGSASAQTFNYTGTKINVLLNPGVYNFTLYGAQGSSFYSRGGLGAEVSGDFSFFTPINLTLLVGGQGVNSGGGGGSFVAMNLGNNNFIPLIISGGGGGWGGSGSGGNGVIFSSDASGSGGAGGASGGGGGFYSDGGGAGGASGGISFINGGGGGSTQDPNYRAVVSGGYGGGGGGAGINGGADNNGWTGGGGGGFNGGNGNSYYNAGGGGSSYINALASNANGTSGVSSPNGSRDGEIIISLIASVPEPSTYALFGIGAIGMLMVLRRKKAA